MTQPDYSIPIWPYAWGGPLGAGRIKSSPGDFIVEEKLPFSPEGTGEHVFLQIEKCGENTEFVARALARFAGVRQRDIGYAGLKDRHALTTQWFSIWMPGKKEPNWTEFETDSIKVQQIVRHARKLKRGVIDHNAFQIRIKNWHIAPSETSQRLRIIQQHGFPNYFSEQRFGHNGQNVMKASHFLVERKRIHREQKRLYLSAIRSFLFNQILAERVRRQNWNRLLQGEICQLNLSNSEFRADNIDKALEQRMQDGDIHAAGRLWGAGAHDAGNCAGQLEKRVVDRYPGLLRILTNHEIKSDRRALRVYPQNMKWLFMNNNELHLWFNLPAGSYATSLLREMMVIHQPSVRHPPVHMS